MATISQITVGSTTYDILDKSTSTFAQELATRLAAIEGKSLIDIKGSVSTADDLPSSDVENGDAYFVGANNEDKNLYIYTEAGWEDVGVVAAAVDLSNCAKLNYSNVFGGKQYFTGDIAVDGMLSDATGNYEITVEELVKHRNFIDGIQVTLNEDDDYSLVIPDSNL